MNTTARDARIAALLRKAADELDPPKAARSTRTRKAPKVTVKVETAAKAKKSDQTRETLTRKDWNRTLTTLAKTTQPKGSGAYAYVVEAGTWALAADLRAKGATPAAALEVLLANR